MPTLGPDFTTDRAGGGPEHKQVLDHDPGPARRLARADGSTRYYFGVVNPTYSSGVAGIGYVGGDRDGVGQDGADWSRPTSGDTTGGGNHSPCGGAGIRTRNYPVCRRRHRRLRLRRHDAALKPPSYTDLMGYCNNEWISDYTYIGVLDFRAAAARVAAAFAQAMQPCLLVWGRIGTASPCSSPPSRS